MHAKLHLLICKWNDNKKTRSHYTSSRVRVRIDSNYFGMCMSYTMIGGSVSVATTILHGVGCLFVRHPFGPYVGPVVGRLRCQFARQSADLLLQVAMYARWYARCECVYVTSQVNVVNPASQSEWKRRSIKLKTEQRQCSRQPHVHMSGSAQHSWHFSKGHLTCSMRFICNFAIKYRKLAIIWRAELVSHSRCIISQRMHTRAHTPQ